MIAPTPPDAATCAHAWEPTGITVLVSGRKWRHGDKCSYCPLCRQFGRRTNLFLDGIFYKTQGEADRANADAMERYHAEKRAWQQEHYPAHVPAAPPRAVAAPGGETTP